MSAIRFAGLAICLAFATVPGSASAEPPLVAFGFPGETYVVPKPDFIGANTVIDNSGQTALQIEFSALFAKRFGTLTTANVGATLIISICGVEISRPRIMSPILGTTAMIPVASPEEAARLADRLNARDCSTVGN